MFHPPKFILMTFLSFSPPIFAPSPCKFGVRLVPLYPPACRKRRLKGRVRGSIVATSAAARCQDPRFYPGQGRNFDRVFCSMCTAVPPLGPQYRVPEPVPSLETHLKSE